MLAKTTQINHNHTSMRIVVPCSSADIHLLPDFVELFRRLGGATKHSIFLCPTRDVKAQAEQASILMALFAKSCQVIPWNMDNKQKWPMAGNDMFIHCMIEMERQKTGDSEAKYYMELDNTPLVPGWADKLETEYTMSGCKFMGAVVGTRKYPAGQPQKTVVDESDPHMVGTGIYPPRLNAFLEGQHKFARTEAWDIFTRFYMRRSLHATNLIDHHWSTINYREVGDQIICDNAPDNPFGTDHSGPISKEAVVVHGAKDGSLARLLLSKLPETTKVVIPMPVQAEKKPNQPQSLANVKFDSGSFQNFQRLANPQSVELPKPPPPQQVQIPVFAELPSDSEEENTEAEEPSGEPQTLPDAPETPEAPQEQEPIKTALETIMEAIEANPKHYRLADLSKIVHLTPLRIRKLAGAPDCPFEVTPKGGWVKKKELTPA